ncbi:helix-turn-helix domain-containing protein [Bradyrhizobium sp. LB11.1]|uniref:helix-turn-helix domain-containing protein n=1 Tax=Bradyrhizobium sp. LB11.1 TaxID=3156326 RepID=UPI0033928964
MPMSWQATAWAMRQRVKPPARKLLLLVLATYADKHGICWPSQETLADDAGMSLDTIQRHTKKLKHGGLLSITRPPKRRGQWQTFVYQLSMSTPEAGPQNAYQSQNADRPLRTKPGGQGGNRPATSGNFAKHYSGERLAASGSLIEAADCLIQTIRSFDAGPRDVSGTCQAAARTIDVDSGLSDCGMAAPHTERQPGRAAMRLKPSIEPLREPSAATSSNDAGARLQAFRDKQEPTEAIQNRIACKLGPDGWVLLGELDNAELERLTALERRHQLDDETLRLTKLRARSAR